MKRLRGRLTYSNVIFTLCLILLIGGGTAYAATQLPRKPRRRLPGGHATIAMTGGVTVASGGNAELQCESSGAGGNVIGPSITAIQVAELKVE